MSRDYTSITCSYQTLIGTPVAVGYSWHCIRFLKLPSRAIHNFERKNIEVNHNNNMRWILSFLLLGLLSAVSALSAGGNKLLVVLEELSEKSKYSKYFGDLEGML